MLHLYLSSTGPSLLLWPTGVSGWGWAWLWGQLHLPMRNRPAPVLEQPRRRPCARRIFSNAAVIALAAGFGTVRRTQGVGPSWLW